MIGQKLGGYEIRELIGSGGMATVYKAYDPTLNRMVAIKTLPPQYTHNEMFRTRFEREARAITQLEHSHILPVFRHGEDQGIAYLAMRYVEAGTLKEWLSRRPIPLRQTFNIIEQIAGALDYAHQNGILHRDIKPSNVLIDETDNTYLTDFGLAKILEDSVGGLTATGFLGTPRYMSPEQSTDAREITAASDQYSLAVILYQMLTGQTPYNVDTPVAIVNKHLTKAPFASPCELRPELPSDAEAVVLKALAHDPIDRFESCGDMAQAFGRAIQAHIATEYQYVDPPTLASEITNTRHQIVADTVSPAGHVTPAPWDTPQPHFMVAPSRQKNQIWLWGILAVVVIGIVVGILMLTRDGDNNNSSAVSRPSATRFATPFPTRPIIATLIVIVSETPELPTITALPTLMTRANTVAAGTVTPLRIESTNNCEQYAIQAGDTFFGIAVMFDVNASDLAELNGLSENPLLQIGEILWIPSDTCQAPPALSLIPTTDIIAINQTATALLSPIKLSVRNPGDFDNEAVGITNLSSALNISGWQLVDEDGHIFEFPDMVLFSSASMTVYTRSGQNTPVGLFWNETESIWQDGEIGNVFDDDGDIVATFVVGLE